MRPEETSGAIAVTGCGVITSIGIGAGAFAEGVRAARACRRPLEGGNGYPCAEACTIPEFEAGRFLHGRGTRVLDRTMALAVCATGLALQDGRVEVTPARSSTLGLVLGTSNGSAKSTFEYTRETLVGKKPYLVSPELFPNTVMNGAAGQCAIWHKLKALNTTISGGRLAGILTLRYAARMLRCGYAEMVVAGGVEEFSAEMAWASHLAAQAQDEAMPLLGEGCAMFLLERADRARAGERRVLAELLACEVGVHGSAQADGLAACIRRALERAGASPREVWAVSRRASGLRHLDSVEAEALRLALDGGSPDRHVCIGQLVGECFSASAALQLAALLALFAEPEGRGRIGLVTSLAHGGGVGCAVVRGV
ncbi:MAG TPA: beta-ketoacyl synthase N-terminal-like domain-containing protein [Vicinamibacteria bacterium]|jgi:3-oxoacyl-[acyl-carrier-protein] synthase II